MVSRSDIITEIQRLAKLHGRPPGKQLFASETGVRESEWYGKIFRTWSDALTEAGCEPNVKQPRIPSEDLLKAYIELTRKLKKIPAAIDIDLEAKSNPGFPAKKTLYRRFGTKGGILARLREWAETDPQYGDLKPLIPKSPTIDNQPDANTIDGYVYLLRSGQHYKIGHSKNLVRRVKEISIALPEDVDLVHAIKTDDASGIESYWLRRYAEKRANGEWFKLNNADLKAFKLRKFQ